MQCVRKGLMIALLAAALPVSAMADEVPGSGFRSGNWHGAAYLGDDGSFSHCAIHTGYRSGIDLHFAIDGKYLWRLGLAHKDWRMSGSEGFPVRYRVDRHGVIDGQARIVSPSFFLVELIAEDRIFHQFRRGSNLEVMAGDQTYSFRLTGTSRALNRVLRCVNAYLDYRSSGTPSASAGGSAGKSLDSRIPTGPGDKTFDPSHYAKTHFEPGGDFKSMIPADLPPATAETDRPPAAPAAPASETAEAARLALVETPRQPAARSAIVFEDAATGGSAAAFVTDPQSLLDATRFMIGLFAAPDYAGYRLDNVVPADDPFLAGAAISWVSGDGDGALRVSGQTDAGLVISDAVAQDARNCNGSFASGKKPAAENPAILTAFSACKTGDGSEAYVDYVAFRHGSGKIYLIADRRDGAPESEEAGGITARSIAQAMR